MEAQIPDASFKQQTASPPVFLVQAHACASRTDALHGRWNWSSHSGFLFSMAETMERKLLEETKQLELDLNDERLRYQNLLNEFSRLEERYDDLKDEMNLMVVSG